MKVELVDTLEGFRNLESEYTALLGRTDNDLPFLLHPWLFTWWRIFAKNERTIKDSLSLRIVRRQGELVGVLPLMLTERPSFGLFRARILQMLGADAYITELRRAVVDPAHETEVSRVLVTHLQQDSDWDWIRWTGLVRGSSLAAALEREVPLEWMTAVTAHVLALAPTWEEFKSRLKRNIKESLRHCYNSLKKAGHEFELGIAASPSDVARDLEVFLRLHAMRADVTGLVQHPNRFSSEISRRFLSDVMGALASRGVARIFTLRVNGAPVASRIGFVLPNCLYLYYSGCDPAWGKYAVMTTTGAEAIKYAIAERLGSVNLSTGTDVSKTRWGTREIVFEDAVTVRRSLYSRGVFESYRLAANASDPRVRKLIQRMLPPRWTLPQPVDTSGVGVSPRGGTSQGEAGGEPGKPRAAVVQAGGQGRGRRRGAGRPG